MYKRITLLLTLLFASVTQPSHGFVGRHAFKIGAGLCAGFAAYDTYRARQNNIAESNRVITATHQLLVNQRAENRTAQLQSLQQKIGGMIAPAAAHQLKEGIISIDPDGTYFSPPFTGKERLLNLDSTIHASYSPGIFGLLNPKMKDLAVTYGKITMELDVCPNNTKACKLYKSSILNKIS